MSRSVASFRRIVTRHVAIPHSHSQSRHANSLSFLLWRAGVAVSFVLLFVTTQSGLPVCIDDGTTVTCTGDLSSGVYLVAPPASPIFDVRDLTIDIAPAVGTDGIELIGDTLTDRSGQSLELNFTGLNSATSDDWSIIASGDGAQGINTSSMAADGPNGANGTFTSPLGKPGGTGGTGGSIDIDSVGDVQTSGSDAEILFALSAAGDGGDGGDGVWYRSGGTGGAGGLGGDLLLLGSGALAATGAENSPGIVALTNAGDGGMGGDGGAGANGGLGGSGGAAGMVEIDGSWAVETAGANSAGILGISTAGSGGTGGESRTGGTGGAGNLVQIALNGSINTAGSDSPSILAHSRAGRGGNGGGPDGSGAGGGGGTGGLGGDLFVAGSGPLTATGSANSQGILATTAAGTGGNGANGAAGYNGGLGGAGGIGGSLDITGDWVISTSGTHSAGILGLSLAGAGGVAGEARTGGTGGSGNLVQLNIAGTISTAGEYSAGVSATSQGGRGGKGGEALQAGEGGNGGAGGLGGDVLLVSEANITTGLEASEGIYALSLGGAGGNGGSGGSLDLGGPGGGGGTGGNGGAVSVHGTNAVATLHDYSVGLLALSQAGRGGNGGDGNGEIGKGGYGGLGGDGGTVLVDGSWSIDTLGDESHGIVAASQGGTGGQAGEGGSWYGTGGGGGDSGHGGNIDVRFGPDALSELGGQIHTSGTTAHGILAQSVGGLAGAGGEAGFFFSSGGDGGSAGNGGSVSVLNSGTIYTAGLASDGIVAQSVGGGGGSSGAGGVLFSGGSGDSEAGGDGGAVHVANAGEIRTASKAARGVFAQSVGGSGGNAAAQEGAWTSIGSTGGEGGDGANVTAENTGQLVTLADDAAGIFAQSVGGGGGHGSNVLGVGAFAAVTIGGNGGGGGNGGTVYVSNFAGSITTGAPGISGDRSPGIFAQSVGGGGGNGGFSASASAGTLLSGALALGGTGGDGGAADIVEVDSTGSIATYGANASAIFAQSVGGSGGNGGFSVGASGALDGEAISLSIGGAGGVGDDAGPVIVGRDALVSGNITTQGDRSYGIFAQSAGGGGGNGGFSIGGSMSNTGTLALSLGGAGGDGGQGNLVSAQIAANISTAGDDAIGILGQSVGGGGGTGGLSVAGSLSGGGALNLAVGGAGGMGGTAASANVTNVGVVNTSGTRSHGVVAQSVGGSGGVGGFSIAGSISAGPALNLSMGGRGGTGGTADTATLLNQGSVSTTGDDAHGLVAQSLGGGGGSGGFSIAGGISSISSLNIAFGGEGGIGGLAGDVVLHNEGNVLTQGSGADAILAQSLGGGGGNGGFSVAGGIAAGVSGATAITVTRGGDGGTGNDAGNVTLDSMGTIIATTGRGARAIVAESTGGGGGSGGFSVGGAVSDLAINFSMGGTGGAGGHGGAIDLISTSSVTTLGDEAHGIYAESLGGGGGAGGFSVAGSLSRTGAIDFSLGGDGGLGGDGNAVSVLSEGTSISTGQLLPSGASTGTRAAGIAARSTGGGGGDAGFSVAAGITNGTSLSLSLGGDGGVAGHGGQVTVASLSSIRTHGADAPGIQAASQGGGGGNGGFSIAGGVSISGPVSVSVGKGGDGGTGGNGGLVNVGLATNPVAGNIQTRGDRSVGIQATSRGGGGGNGGFSVAGGLSIEGPTVNLSVGGTGASGGDADEVHLFSEAAIATTGAMAHGIQAQSLGGGGGNGGFSVAGGISPQVGVNLSIGGYGAAAGVGGRVAVDNAGAITTQGGSAHAIQAESIGGGGGNGGFSVAGSLAFKPGTASKMVNLSVGGFGGDGNLGGPVTVDNAGTLATSGARSHGISAQSVGGGGGNGGFSVVGGLAITGGAGSSDAVNFNASMGGRGGFGNVGGNVDVSNQGGISTDGLGSYAISAVSRGGGGGDGGFSNAFTVGLGAASEGATLNMAASVGGFGGDGNLGGTVEVMNQGILSTDGGGAHGIFAQSIGGGGGDAGDAAALSLALDKACFGDPACKEAQQTDNNYSVAASVGGFGGAGSHGSAVDVLNLGNIETLQEGSHAIVAQSVGAGGGNGGSGIRGGGELTKFAGLDLDDATIPFDKLEKNLQSWNLNVGGDAGTSGNGSAVRVVNDGAITTWGTILEIEEGQVTQVGREGGYGILAQSIGGGGGTSIHTPRGGTADVGLTGFIGLGGAGGAAGNGDNVDIYHGYVVPEGELTPIPSATPAQAIETYGDGAHAILAQSVGGGGGVAGDVNGGTPLVPQAIGYGLNELFGRGTGSSGDGGAVATRTRGDIITHGSEAIGILAQSVGGGGGIGGNLLVVDDPFTDKTLFEIGKFYGSVGGDGSGGAVFVQQLGDITTAGQRAHGIFAQSAGGVADQVSLTTLATDDDGNPVLDEDGHPTQIPVLDDFDQPVLVPDTGDLGSPVQVVVEGNITTTGYEAHGIFAQSLGDDGNGNITIDVLAGTTQGGIEGHAVRLLDGANNRVTNYGMLTTTVGISGTAMLAGAGNETVDNHGTIVGSIDLGSGANSVSNSPTGILNTGPQINLAGGLLTSGGLLSPGGAGTTEQTQIVGDLQLTSTSVLAMQLGGDLVGQYDQLYHNTPDGSAVLGGELLVSLVGSYVPAVGDAFDVVTAVGGVTGEFSVENLPVLGGGLLLDVLYGTHAMQLFVAGVAGDYNNDGLVNVVDYTVWRNTLGQAGAGLAADGNHNGVVDTGDYEVWKLHFGELAVTALAASKHGSIPEPGSAVLLAIATITIAVTCRRRAGRWC